MENTTTKQVATQQPQAPAQAQPEQNNALRSFTNYIFADSTQNYITKLVGEHKRDFTNNILSLVNGDNNLQQCDPKTIMFAALKATTFDMPIDKNLGLVYIIPFTNNKTHKIEAQFMVGVDGLIQLGMRSGQYKTINTGEVKEGELIEENILSGEIVLKKVPNREKVQTIGYFAYFKLRNGFEKTLYATTAEIDAHAVRYSQSYSSKNKYVKDNSPWTTNFSQMAQKTLLRRLLKKYGPKSIETRIIDEAIAADQAVITEKGNQYVDNAQIIETASEEMPTAEVVQEQPTAQPQEQPQPQQQEIPLPDAFKGI